nr:pilus assembly protein PilM [Thermoclostridium sp.]
KLCFEFYVKRCYGQLISQIYVIGGGSQLKGLQEYLTDVLDVPVYPIGLLSIDNIEIDDKLDVSRLNYLINSIGIALDA